jgi:hypothetical protein
MAMKCKTVRVPSWNRESGPPPECGSPFEAGGKTGYGVTHG